jgi:alkylhydroperoxidase family enzyme
MAYIRLIADDEATGRLAEQFDAARRRAGKVWNIVRIMGGNPAALETSIALYRAVMFGPSPLSRARREMLAVVVSLRNRCHY